MNRKWAGLDDFKAQYIEDPELSKSFVIMINIFEGFGVLLKKGLDGDLLYEQMPTNAFYMWDKYEPWIKYVRLEMNYPQYARPWEYLADEMKRIAKDRGDPIDIQYSYRNTSDR